jgi:hypothetical protein
LLAEGEPWEKQEIQHFINPEFDFKFHLNYLPRLLDDLGLSYAIPRTERLDRSENADEILDERVADAFTEDDGDEPHTTSEMRTTMTTNGRSTMMFEQMAEQQSIFLMFRIHNHGTILSGSTR